MKNSLALAALACSLLGCSPDGGHMSISGSDDGKGPTPDANGQTGSPGAQANECKQAKDCVARAQDELAALEKPAANARTFSGAQCIQLGVTGAQSASGPACECSTGDGGSLSIGPAGLGCFAYGRGGDCLWDDSEFDGCVVGEKDACEDVCAEFGKRIADDAARSFDTRVVYTACDEQTVCHDVVEVDGRCYADRSYQNGRDYDCALGGEEILKRDADDQNPEMTEIPPRPSPYVTGTDGFVELLVNSGFSGTAKLFTVFAGEAQFFTTIGGEGTDFGEVLDPLDGVDDCGVALSNGTGTQPPFSLIDIGQLALQDGGQSLAFELSSASHDDFYQYILDLPEVEPRYGGSYRVSGGGGTFGETIAIDDLRLPEALSIDQLEASSRIDRAALKLTWSGRGDAPLRATFMVMPKLTDAGEPYTIECLMKDDGEFEIPEAVLTAAPEGFVQAYFARERRTLEPAGSKTVLAIGRVSVEHRFALGKACDRADVLEACKAAAEKIDAEYDKCGVPLPMLAEQCPDYLAEACGGCSEYFECLATHTTCTDQGLSSSIGCSCR